MAIKDKDIRYKYLKDNAEFFNSGLFLNEYGINGKNIVDFACLNNGIFYGYEIKSEADNTLRLLSQLKTYVSFFDCVKLIVHVKHEKEVYNLLTKYKLKNVGLIIVDSDLKFREVIQAKLLDNKFRLGNLLRNISKDNLKKILDDKNIKHTSSRYSMGSLLVGKLSISEVMSVLEEQFKLRSDKCTLCKSSLTVNTSDILEEFITDKKVDIKNKKVYLNKVKHTYKRKICRCINCGGIYKEKSRTRIKSIIQSTKVSSL